MNTRHRSQDHNANNLFGSANQQASSNATIESASRYDKICIGTSNRMSGQQNKTDHYKNLFERYKNCSYVIGNLEITWIEKTHDGKPVDLSFLESIREITGYLLIAYVQVERISMPNLHIIRGRDLFKLNNGNKSDFAMFLIDNEIRSLELPNLREIITGNVGFYDNRNLCHMESIEWKEVINPEYSKHTSLEGPLPECPACHQSCRSSSCWGEGPDLCQKFSKTICAPQCGHNGRCFGSGPRECCHNFCAGGCTGPSETDCIACKNFYNDGSCVQECPSIQKYNTNKFLWEEDPDGKYAYGATCVRQCPEHLLRDNGACVRICPPNKRNNGEGECVPCGGPCPKNCQGVEVVHSGNIDQLINCTEIEGSITILDTSFSGYAEVYSNNTIGARHKPMHPSRLEVFKTLHNITGFLNIQASHPDFKNLSYFRNLRYIGGRDTTDMFYALQIIKTSLKSLNLRSLRGVRSGRITIEDNKDLCFADTINWSQLNITRKDDVHVRDNMPKERCRQLGLHCHKQCSKDGCWGPGQDECLSCNHYKFENYCVDDCNATAKLGFLSFVSGDRTCTKCHNECRGGCSGVEASSCWQCKNVKDGPYCVANCPKHKYSNGSTCEDCNPVCRDGCTGPSNKLGQGGCNQCGKTVITSINPFAGYCIKDNETCPDGYFQEYLGPSTEGPLKSPFHKPVCRKCHSRCKTCTGMGTHTSVCECARYVAGEQCEDSCSRDFYPDDKLGECLRCAPECNGCFGPTDAQCASCRVYRIYDEGVIGANLSVADTTRGFRCTLQCPPDKPHRISEGNMLDPYCSDTPSTDPDNPRIVWLGSTSALLMIITCVSVMICVYRCQIEQDKTVKLTMRLSGFDDVEPLNQSNVKPNLGALRSIKKDDLRQGELLGEGIGGMVYKGLWYQDGKGKGNPRPVAIKVLKSSGQGSSNVNKEFLDEAYIMASVNHPNLVRLLGVCVPQGSPMLITQLMPLGCLLNYVIEKKDEIGSKNLFEWCKQIARGMSYLEENSIVHRDLALRNVLLQTTGRAMISDFGLAKFLDVDQSEYHSGGGRLPIKWLAPECIKERKFTHKSDVWAFGVTIWELLTFGMKPFENIDTKEVPKHIEAGARLPQASHMTTEVYKVMYSCWFYSPDDRPDFKFLLNNFKQFARDPARYLSINNRGIEYTNRRELGRNSDSDVDGYSMNSSNGVDNSAECITTELRPCLESAENGHDEDYLEPSPCVTGDTFSFKPELLHLSRPRPLSSRDVPFPREIPSIHDPPHSAGLIGIENQEYFMTRLNYVNSTGSHGALTSIPISLV